MSSSCTPSSKTLSGIETNNGALSGGASGQVPYQSAPGITTFSNSTSGVLENISNAVNFTDTPTTIRKISTPASQDLDLEATSVTKKIKLTTNVGDISFSVDAGATEAFVVKSDSTLQTQISSAAFLRTDALGIIEAGSGGLPSSSLLGGAAGQVLYQSATNVTTFSNASNGVLENVGNSVNFSNTPTTIQSVTAPIAANLTLTTPTVSNNILLKTNAGTINLNTNNGGLNAWTIAATTGDLSSAISNILLTGGDVTVSNSGYLASLGPGELFIQFAGQSVHLNETEMQFTGQDFLFRVVTAAKLLRLRTNAGPIHFNTNNGGDDAWTINETSGVLTSATSDLTLTGGNSCIVSNGINSSTISPAEIILSYPVSGALCRIYPDAMVFSNVDFLFDASSLGQNITYRTNDGSIHFNTYNGGDNAWTIAATSGVLTSATSDLTLTGGNSCIVSSGINSSTLSPAVLYLGFAAGSTNIFGNTMQMTGTDYVFDCTTATKLLRLRTNAGPIHFNTNNGGDDAWTINETSGVLTSATSDLTLTGGNSCIVSNGINSSTISPAEIILSYPVSGALCRIYPDAMVFSNVDFLFDASSLGQNITYRTNDGAIHFNTYNGGDNAWTIAATSGVLTSATSNISLTGGNVYLVSSGSNSSQLAPSVLYLTFGAGTTNFFGNQMITTNSSYAFRTATATSILALTTNAGDINMSTNTGTTTAFNINSSNQIRLPLITNAPFLKTGATGIVDAGTVLGVANGGTGVSSITIPKISVFIISGTFTFTGTPKYFTVEICGAGGGGGGSVGTNDIAGGGGGGGYAKAAYAYNATPGFYTYSLAIAPTGGLSLTGSDGTSGGSSTFSANGVVQFTVTGGAGGKGATTPGRYVGGAGGTASGTFGESSIGDYGGHATDIAGGSGGGSRLSGGVTNASVASSHNGTNAPGPCTGGCGGRDGDGGSGGSAKIIITEYYI